MISCPGLFTRIKEKILLHPTCGSSCKGEGGQKWGKGLNCWLSYSTLEFTLSVRHPESLTVRISLVGWGLEQSKGSRARCKTLLRGSRFDFLWFFIRSRKGKLIGKEVPTVHLTSCSSTYPCSLPPSSTIYPKTLGSEWRWFRRRILFLEFSVCFPDVGNPNVRFPKSVTRASPRPYRSLLRSSHPRPRHPRPRPRRHVPEIPSSLATKEAFPLTSQRTPSGRDQAEDKVPTPVGCLVWPSEHYRRLTPRPQIKTSRILIPLDGRRTLVY